MDFNFTYYAALGQQGEREPFFHSDGWVELHLLGVRAIAQNNAKQYLNAINV